MRARHRPAGCRNRGGATANSRRTIASAPEFGRHDAIHGLIRAGCAAFGQNSRQLNNDTETIHERLPLDIAAGMRPLRTAGFRKIVRATNSGGARSSLLDQVLRDSCIGYRRRFVVSAR